MDVTSQHPSVFCWWNQALVDKPSIFEDLGFVAPEGSFLADPCMGTNFDVDYAAEIMGTQVSAWRCHSQRRSFKKATIRTETESIRKNTHRLGIRQHHRL